MIVGFFCVGTPLVAIRFLAGEADAATITTWRVATGVVLLPPFALWLERGWPCGRDVLVPAGLGVLMFAGLAAIVAGVLLANWRRGRPTR